MTRTLVLGGARSGKSGYAEARVVAAPAVDYVATSQRRDDDPEWDARIALHVARRPAHWATIETMDLASVLLTPGPVALVDCLTVWLSRALDEAGSWPELESYDPVASASALAERTGAVVDAVRDARRDVVLVSNEVGQGLVPATASGRLFRDEMGRLNAAVAAVCDEVWFVTAGIPSRLK